METINLETFAQRITQADTLHDLDAARLAFSGKNGALTLEMKKLKNLTSAERQEKGAYLNQVKADFHALWKEKYRLLQDSERLAQLEQDACDVTLPPSPADACLGSYHPLSKAMADMVRIFERMDFSVRQGPDIEDDYHNFTALNIPAHHPARLSHDTFYMKGGDLLLRTHTSSVQIRTLAEERPPLRIIAPGKVYRDDYDATHTPMFHQIEGLVIEPGIHMGHLKWCLEFFLNTFFERPMKLRFRPNFFPFTEPSAEVDVLFDDPHNPESRHHQKWLEVLGCGMVHPNVLKEMNLDPHRYQGWAFGMGVERLTMLKYNIQDLRAFFANDTRWVHQFNFSTP
ncbi:phenylalanine--tRNA ligase subunit alpha [bacterium NHP-B]|nr:phenylalanine--tRNA ligase subunit alpha [bacterium NHP-B]